MSSLASVRRMYSNAARAIPTSTIATLGSESDQFRLLLAKVVTGGTLTEQESETAFAILTAGNATPAQIGGFLMVLRARGETPQEVIGAARTLRARALKVKAPDNAIDIVGTGGDAQGTYNISTCASLVVAGAGVPVAKSGNRAVTSKSGSADVLKALGLNYDVSVPLLERELREAGIAFLMGPRHHGAMRNVAGLRGELAPTRTIFNFIGPLCHCASVKRQLVGVYDRRWVLSAAKILGRLGLERAIVVNGSDGMDELTTTGVSYCAEWRDGRGRKFKVEPEDAGLPRATPEQLKGGDPAHNAQAIRAVLAGEKGPFRDIVLLNSAMALYLADKAADLRDGVRVAAEAIDSGKAQAALEKLLALGATERVID